MLSGKLNRFFKNSKANVFIGSILFSVLITGFLQAQNFQIKAYVSKNKVSINENFTYSIEVSGRSTSLPDPKHPDFNDFYVLSGPNTSTSIQFVNGRMNSSKVFSYYLQPRKKGKLVIAPATVQYKGKTYSSNSITVTVTEVSQQATGPKRTKPPKRRTDKDLIGQSIYLKTSVSKRKAYVGEQIIVEYKLYFRVNVRGYNFQKLPSNPGFWTEEFEIPSQPTIENEIVNGLNYNVATIRKIAVFPTQSGELTLEPISVLVEAQVRRRSRSIFDSFFDDPFGNVVQKTISSRPIKIEAMDLPEEGKPADFSGAIGDFSLKVSVDKKEAKTNEAVALKVVISGRGNIKMVNLPEVTVPPDIEKYDPKVMTNINNLRSEISGTKKAEYILIPRIPGDYQIKPLRFSFFNPRTRKYVTLTSKPINLHVTGEQSVALGVPGGGGAVDQRYIEMIGQDIRFIKEFARFQPVGYRPYLSFKFWGLIGLGLVFFVLFVLVNDYQSKLASDERLIRSRKAGRIAAKQLSRAREALKTEDHSQFYKAVSLALQGFVRDKLNLELSDFSTPNVRKHLSERQIDPQVIEEYVSVLEEADFRQFANIPATQEERRAFYDRAKEVLTILEKWI
ncbi:MAG: protein BatD [Calditrichaeota bacterium]|nr:protein BatD [Calditrichota bacterium]